MKPRNTKKNIRNKRRKTQHKRRHGGRIGSNTADFYLLAIPRTTKEKDRIMYYTQFDHDDSSDLMNIGFIEDYMETMVKSTKPPITFHRRYRIKAKEE
jgi:hypothetical protein